MENGCLQSFSIFLYTPFRHPFQVARYGSNQPRKSGNNRSTSPDPASRIICRNPKNSGKILNFAVRLYYQLSYNYSAQYNMLLINALGIH